MPTVDSALEVLDNESLQDLLIGDLAFEQAASNPLKVRGGAAASFGK